MSTAERPIRADARRNQERLVDAAREAFNESGVNAPLDDIARRAGVGPGTLYRHFPTREDLMLAVYRRDVEAIDARSLELAATLPPWEALIVYLREQLAFVTKRNGLGTAIKKMISTDSETLDACKTTMRGASGRLLVRAQEAGLVRRDVDPTMIMRMVHGVGVASETAPEQAELMMGIIIDGLKVG